MEDEPDIANLLAQQLRLIGCEPRCVPDGATGLRLAVDSASWSLLILDLRLPDVDGIEICRTVRERGLGSPIMILSARSSEQERIFGLDCGADDYLTKPFSVVEFAARANALLRRAERWNCGPATVPPEIRCGPLQLDLHQRSARCAGRNVELTAREFDLLAFLMRSPGRVYTRAQLLDQVWGSHFVAFEHTVNSHINRLRTKLANDAGGHQFIQTVWGSGYRLATPNNWPQS